MTQQEFDAEVSAEIRRRIDAAEEREEGAVYPTLAEVADAGLDRLARWHRSLPAAQGSMDVLVIVAIRDRIRELGGQP